MHTVRAGDVHMPAIGFGTWMLQADTARDLVAQALSVGYRHVDTAAAYGNEAQVGEAIRASSVPRDQIFLTTKIWIDNFRDGDLQAAAEAALGRLGLDHVDLLLLHWPKPEPALAETIGALNQVRERGLTRAIGVSNFPSALFEQAATLSSAPLATDQVEYHPFLTQKAVLAAARARGAALTAWSPLAQGKVAQDPVILGIAEAHAKTPGQVALRWLIQQEGVVAIPRTSNPARVRENLDVDDFTLSEAEMAAVSALGSPQGRIGDWIDPAFKWDAE